MDNIMKILLVRHGETDWNVAQRIQGSTDTPLNETGIMQAQKLAEELAKRETPIIGVYTSKLERAAKTAECVAEKLGKECIVLPGLEEINFGLWEGITWEQVAEQFPEEYQIWRQNRRYEHPPKGESYQELVERVVAALQKLLKELKAGNCPDTETAADEGNVPVNGDIVVVTHSADIMSLMSFVNDTPFHEMVKRYRTKNTAIVEIEAEVIEGLEL